MSRLLRTNENIVIYVDISSSAVVDVVLATIVEQSWNSLVTFVIDFNTK